MRKATVWRAISARSYPSEALATSDRASSAVTTIHGFDFNLARPPRPSHATAAGPRLLHLLSGTLLIPVTGVLLPICLVAATSQTHIPASFLIDFQVIYPQGWVPKLIAGLPDWYIKFSNDPLIAGGMGYFGQRETYLWFHTFLYLEM